MLYGELDAAQSRVQQLREPSLVQGHTAGDELGVEAHGVGGGDDPGEIAPEEGFAAGQVGLDNAQFSGLVKDVGPIVRRSALLTD